MYKIELKADFFTDWVNFARDELIAFGIDVPNDASDDDILYAYFTTHKRIIVPCPRSIEYSSVFNIPPTPSGSPDYQQGFDQLKDKIVKGEVLTPHLSRQIYKFGKQDSMLNDWGIHHFHLGSQPDPRRPNLIQGTKDVIFAFITDNLCFMINVYDHNNWTEREVIKIIHDEKSELLDKYKLKGVSGIHPKDITNEEHAQLRKKGANILLDFGDGVYMPPGGGQATSGHSIEIIRASDVVKHKCRQLDRWLVSQEQNLVNDFKAINTGVNIPAEIEFHLRSTGSEWIIRSQTGMTELSVPVNGDFF